MKNFFVLLIPLFLTGCMTPYVTQTERSGVEQLLLSASADRSIAKLNADFLKGKKVFLDTSNLESVDKGYVTGSTKAKLARCGVLVTDSADGAEIIVEVYSGALATDGDDFLIGIPSMGLPVPFAGPITTPEIAIIKKVSQLGVSKLGFHGYKVVDNKLVFSTETLSGTAYFHRWQILFIGFARTDIPEKLNNTAR